MPLLKELVRPRRKLLAVGFVLMLINRLAGLVLPASTKYLVDNVIGQKRQDLLTTLVLAVLGATCCRRSPPSPSRSCSRRRRSG